MATFATLWEILDHRRRSPAIVDSRDDGAGNPFAPPRPLRWKLGRQHASLLVAGVLVLVIGASFLRTLIPGPEPMPIPLARETTENVVSSEAIVVHVVGAVTSPGVVSLPPSSRVQDAILQAGGLLDEAEVSGVNLARLVVDGEQIVVPRRGESAVVGAEGTVGRISLSQADQATLETLPRIGPATAARIIEWRDNNGPFRSVEDLLAVSGIGTATLEGLVDLVVP